MTKAVPRTFGWSGPRGKSGSFLLAIRSAPISAKLGMAVIACWMFVGLAATWLAPHSVGAIASFESFAPPTEAFPLGTDYMGRDLLSRLLYGARMTISLALAATVLGFLLGTSLGFLSALRGGWLDTLITRANDAVLSFPSIMLALIIIASVGPTIPVLLGVVAFVESARVLRVTRALAQDVVVSPYVEVAKLRGEGPLWILSREILPNLGGPLATEFGLRLTFSILFISGLSFLGLGIQPPTPDWGNMVRENLAGLVLGSTAALIPAAAIASLTISVGLIIDWHGAARGRRSFVDLLP